MADPKNCAIVGSTGFLGGYLARCLEGYGIRPLPLNRDRLDFTDVGGITAALQQSSAESIVYLAAHSDPTAGDVETFYKVNAFYLSNFLQAAKTVGLPGRFIYASASSVYGTVEEGDLCEDAPVAPPNHYGASKMLGETFCRWFSADLEVIIARPSNCVGAAQNKKYIVPKIVDAFRKRLPELVLGDTSIARDFVDVRDAVDIFAQILRAQTAPSVVNVSSGRATQIREIIRTLKEISGFCPEITQSEQFMRKGDIYHQSVNNQVARNLGHEPKFSLRDTLGWMLDQ
ncbi:MAG: NAD-dependent epimerase/dehydratase family protein [Pseudomonadota bacterium]